MLSFIEKKDPMAIFSTLLKTLSRPCQIQHQNPPAHSLIFKRGLIWKNLQDIKRDQQLRHQQEPQILPPDRNTLYKIHQFQQRITDLLSQDNLDAAIRLLHSRFQSDCQTWSTTINRVMEFQLRHSKYSELIALHNSATKSGVEPCDTTHILLIKAHLRCGNDPAALEHLKQLERVFHVFPMHYKTLITEMVDHSKYDWAIELKDEMLQKGFDIEPSVYGSLMKAYFQKGMDKEGMKYYADALSAVRSGLQGDLRIRSHEYNRVLDALNKYGKYDEAIELFKPNDDRLFNVETFHIMAEGYCSQGRFKEAIEVSSKIGGWGTKGGGIASLNNLIHNLNVYGMEGFEVKDIYGLLIDACFADNRPQDAVKYFQMMIHPSTGLKVDILSYNKMVLGFIKAGKVYEAKGFLDQKVEKFKLELGDCKVKLRAF